MSKIKPLVCYLFTAFDNENSFINFIKNYKKYNAGHKHDLLIFYKLMKTNQIEKFERKISNLKHLIFKDPGKKNDWDFGSYKRVGRKFKKGQFFFK